MTCHASARTVSTSACQAPCKCTGWHTEQSHHLKSKFCTGALHNRPAAGRAAHPRSQSTRRWRRPRPRTCPSRSRELRHTQTAEPSAYAMSHKPLQGPSTGSFRKPAQRERPANPLQQADMRHVLHALSRSIQCNLSAKMLAEAERALFSGSSPYALRLRASSAMYLPVRAQLHVRPSLQRRAATG